MRKPRVEAARPVAAASRPSDPLDAIERWHSQGEQLRVQLVAELEAARGRVADLEKALARLTAARPPTREVEPGAVRFAFPHGMGGALSLDARPPADASLAQLILRAVGERPGVSPAEIAAAVRGYGKAFDPRHVYTYLYRLRKQGLIKVEGPSSARKYFISTHPNNKEEETDASHT